jgi:hypothetical protein
MRRLLVGFLSLAGLTLGGVVLAAGYPIPKELLHQSITCPTSQFLVAQGIQLLETQRWQNGVIALYSASCPSKKHKGTERVMAYRILRREGMNWFAEGSDAHKMKSKPTGKQLAQSNVSYTQDPQGSPYTVLYGQIYSSKVTAIEAAFDNGKTIRTNSSSGLFSLVVPQALQVCEIRMLGADNQILGIEGNMTHGKFAHFRRVRTCPPVSHLI